ncbi:MAG: HYR domain-containing protein [Patiriisocius sp.]|uniref:HYR domain-containing protein n=1 Tax=Patiriisocius sp. TaxID=2822396 RepID=UPI003EFAAAA2
MKKSLLALLLIITASIAFAQISSNFNINPNRSVSCIADFTANPTSNNSVPHSVFFTDNSTNPDTWSWNFGDGSTSTAQNPIHTYATTGAFEVKLTIVDTITGCVNTKIMSDFIKISIPTASFTTNGSNSGAIGCGPLTVNYADTSIGSGAPIVSWNWDFGDGTTSTLQNPTHIYEDSGLYNVSLNITDDFGNTDTILKNALVNVIGPTPDFSTTSTTIGCQPLTIDFVDDSEASAPIIAWDWDFGDGNTSSFQNPSHTYTTSGVFNVSLTITDLDGCLRTETKMDFVSTEDNENPVAICQNITVQLNDFGNVTINAIDIDNGSTDNCGINSLTIDTDTFTCSDVGINTVILTVTDNDGNMDTCTATVTVVDVTPPVIMCPAEPITSQCGDDVIFADPTFTDNCSTAVPTTVPGFTLFGTQGNSTYFISDVAATGPDAFAFADANNYRLATINNEAENQFITSEINNQATGSLFIGYNDVASEGAFVWQSGQPSIYTNWGPGEPNNVGDEDYTEIGNAGTWNDLPSTSSRRYLIEFTDGVIQIAGLPSGAQYPQGTTTNTFYVEDASGNSAMCSFDVVVMDTIPPVITCPADVTLECGDSTLPADTGMATATDNCPAGLTISFVDTSAPGCGLTETITRTWTADDGNGNVVTCDQIITINDTTPPEFIIPNVPPAGANYTLDNTLTANYIPINTPGNFVGSGDDTAFTVGLGAPISIYDNVVSDIRVSTNGYLSVSLTDNGPDLSNDCPLPANPSTGDNVARLYPLHDDVVADIYYQYFGVSPYPHPNGTTMGASVIEYVGSHFGGGVVQFQVILFDNSDVIYQYLSDTEDGSGSTIGAQASGTGLSITVACNTAGTTVGTGIYGLSPYGDVLANSPLSGSTCPGNIAVNNDPGVCTANVTFDPITAIDSCGNVTVVQTAGLPSGSDFPVGTTINTFVATDDCGNMATCSFDVVVTDNELPVANCIAPFTVQLDVNGMASITAADVDNGSTDNCGIASTTIDIMDFTCADVGPNTVTLTVTDVNGNMSTCTTTVTVEDMIAPLANCAAPFTVQLDANGMASITVADIDNGSTDACGIASTTIDVMDFTCADVGPNTVTLTVTDVNGNVSTCTTVVTIEDVTAPVIACPADISIDTTPGDCFAEVSFPDALALDACGIASVIQTMGDPSGSMFPVGDTVIEFTATDVNGNESTCMFTITVMDMEPAMAVCQDITVQLDATGMVTITPADVDGGSSDNCGIATTTIDVDTFDCSDVGPNSVTLTITDVNGNVSTCVAIVTVEDIEAPMVVCQDITVQLDATGTITIVASDLDNGSTDNCTISNFTVDIDTFDCSNVGPNTVVLTATDSNGNTSTCTATVTVEDVTTPELVCMDFTIELGADGTALLDVANVIASNTDACGIDTSAVDITSFDCSDIGTPVMVEVFTQDVNGNISSCNAIVTVVDVLAPEVTCPADITVDPGANNVNYEVPDYVALGDATAVDNCTNPVVIFTQDPAAGTFLPDGVYPVTITAEDEYGNVGSCTFTLTVESILGGIPNNEISLATLIMYPNPAKDYVVLSNPQAINLENVSIYDVNGRLVRTIGLQDMGIEKRMDITDLQSAMYMFVIESEYGVITKQILKE